MTPKKKPEDLKPRGRKKGGHNTPPTLEKALAIVKSAAEREGKHVNLERIFETAEKLPETATATKIAESAAKSLDLELEESEKIIYRCNNCKAELPSEMNACPHCGVALKWG